ncbi:MAG: hypothetical protein ABFD64_03670 [Armatimonadota bacterium]
MNPELLTLRRSTVGLLYPPRGLHPAEVNHIYADITEHYPYQSLQHLPDGARMANSDNDCFIQQSRIQINESVMHFQATKEKCMDMLEIIQSRLSIPQFMTLGIKLTAFVPMNEAPRAAQYIEDKMLSNMSDKLEILGPGRQGAGIRLVLHHEGIHEIKIEPFFNDLSQIYVELDVQHPEPFTDLSDVERKMESAYNYLFGEVKDFLASFS